MRSFKGTSRKLQTQALHHIEMAFDTKVAPKLALHRHAGLCPIELSWSGIKGRASWYRWMDISSEFQKYFLFRCPRRAESSHEACPFAYLMTAVRRHLAATLCLSHLASLNTLYDHHAWSAVLNAHVRLLQ